MKKALKIFFGFILLILITLIVLPIVFQDKIVVLLKEKINENINAKVEFSDVSLSLLRNFPNASIKLEDISIITKAPFEGDTLFYGQKVNLKASIASIIKGDDILIKSFEVTDAKTTIRVNKNGIANYDISKKNTTKKEPSTSSKPNKTTGENKISIDSYKISHLNLLYRDEKSKTEVKLNDFNHTGSGDLSSTRTELTTNTSTSISFLMDGKSYADNIHLDLNATLDLDLENQKFTFLKNEAHINQLPLIFNGFVQLHDNSQEIDITFKTPSSNFKNFLALVPKTYAKNISDVKTSGNFSIDGIINGMITANQIPKINVTIASDNASFKFPDLPKSVQNIHLNTNIRNTTGKTEDTFINIKKVSFKIDDNTFNANAKINQLTTNPLVDATIHGKLNLADLNKVYPLEMKNKLSGLINADLNTKFDANALQKSVPERIKNNGKISLNNFEFNSTEMANPLSIKNAEVDFKPTTISLTNFDAKTGSTDIKAKGTIYDLLGFLLSDKKLKGNFNITSTNFSVADFMQNTSEISSKKTEEPSAEKQSGGELKIPDFLDITTKVAVKNVIYDNLTLTNVRGIMLVKDQKAILKDIHANMFDGTIGLNGAVSTKEKTPNFNMKMGIKNFNISSSFKNIKMLEKLAPIAGFIEGKFNTNIALNGQLNQDFSPVLNSIGGDAFAQVLNQSLNPEKSKAMSLLNNKLKFIDLKKLNLNDVKTHLDFKDGKVNVKPFQIKYKDININIGGSHGFNQSMNYHLTLDVPAKYLGSEVTNLLSKLDAKNKNMKVPVTANLTGNFNNPSVSTDLKSAVTNLTNQLIEQQKTKAINKVSNTVVDKIFGGKKDVKKDSSTSKNNVNDAVKKGVNDILGGLFGGKKKKKGN